MKSSRRVLDDRVLKVGPDAILVRGDEVQVLIGSGTQLGFRAHRHLGADGLLEVGVEPLVGIEFRAVAGQEEDFNVPTVLGKPRLHGLAVMHAQVVQDEEDLLASSPTVAPQRVEELPPASELLSPG